MKTGKRELVDGLRRVFAEWETLLGGLTEEQIMALPGGGKMSIGETITHLKAWQQISISRVEAALHGADPQLPAWLGGADPFYADDHADQSNARIREFWDGQPWPVRHQDWRQGFERFVQLAEAVPEPTMFDATCFNWLRGDALSAVLEGALEHHQEHIDRARERLGGAGLEGGRPASAP